MNTARRCSCLGCLSERLASLRTDDVLVERDVFDPAALLAFADDRSHAASRFTQTNLNLGAQRLTDVGVNCVLGEGRGQHTLQLQNLHASSLEIGALCADLTTRLSEPFVGCNLYVSPAADRPGLSVHADRDDVLVLQLRGTKRWCVWGGPEVFDEQPGVGAEHRALPLVVDEILRPGDVLSLRAGRLHEAICETPPSVHLTFGVRRLRASNIAFLASKLLRAQLDDWPVANSADPDDTDRVTWLDDKLGQLASSVSAAAEALCRRPYQFVDDLGFDLESARLPSEAFSTSQWGTLAHHSGLRSDPDQWYRSTPGLLLAGAFPTGVTKKNAVSQTAGLDQKIYEVLKRLGCRAFTLDDLIRGSGECEGAVRAVLDASLRRNLVIGTKEQKCQR